MRVILENGRKKILDRRKASERQQAELEKKIFLLFQWLHLHRNGIFSVLLSWDHERKGFFQPHFFPFQTSQETCNSAPPGQVLQFVRNSSGCFEQWPAWYVAVFGKVTSLPLAHHHRRKPSSSGDRFRLSGRPFIILRPRRVSSYARVGSGVRVSPTLLPSSSTRKII